MNTTFVRSLQRLLHLPVILVGFLFPCVAGNATAHAATSNVPDVKPMLGAKKHWFQIGRASWYGTIFQGRKTASGEKFDSNAMTAAHRTLPLGSWIRVTNLKNQRSVVVKVNDRGPVPQDRVLDLSHAAASTLGFDGTVAVKIELLKDVAATMMAQMRPPTFAMAQ
jgi:rare lipoprotein A